MAKQQKQVDARVYKSQTEKIHDLYKLEPAAAKKNVSWDGVPTYVNVEHCHFFHSVDAQGTPQNTSTTINGHFHTLTVKTPATEDAPATYTCSGPLKWVVKTLKNGQRKRVLETACGTDEDGQPIDNHTHDITYIQSQKLIPRKANLEAAKLQTQVALKFDQKMPGVIG